MKLKLKVESLVNGVLAASVGVPRQTLQSAVQTNRIPSSKIGVNSETTVVTVEAVLAWKKRWVKK